MEKKYVVVYDTFKLKWNMFKGNELVATYPDKWGDVAKGVSDTLNEKEGLT